MALLLKSSGIDYNTAMDTQLSCGSGTSCWQGQLDPSSSHALGQTVTAKSGAGGGPSPLLSGAKYILLPVISDEGVVVQYGLFTVTGNSKIYTKPWTNKWGLCDLDSGTGTPPPASRVSVSCPGE